MAKTVPTYSQFACIGSGFSGIGLGATLKRWYGITDVRIFERHSDLGGTWFANKYPGCACDVPSILYSFSFSLNAKWSQTLATADELWAYLKDVAREYDLERKISYQSEVTRCEWMAQTSRWRIHIHNLVTDETYVHECQFLFSGTGILVKPRPCDIPGAETFKGHLFHSAEWRQDVDVTDKNVVLVGNGCTACQIVPAIVNKTKHLSQFARSKHWIIPPINVPYTKVWQNIFEHVPGVLRSLRFLLFLFAENDMRGFYMTKAGERFRKYKESVAAEYMKQTAPAKFHDLLIPDFSIGCKRRIYDPGYCEALHAENISLSDEPIVEIVPEGVRTKNGEVTEADIIVLASGFATNQFLGGVDVIGRSGKTIEEHWSSWEGPEAYNCCALNDFPNFFMMLGPNTATGHTSTVMAIENSINFALRIIKPVLDGEAKFAEVRRDAEERYSREMQAALQKSVWFSGCHSWYNKKGADGKTWNAMTYPHWQPVYWYESFFPVSKDWIYPPTPGAARLRARRKALSFTKWMLVFVSALGATMTAKKYWHILSQIVPLTRLAIMQLRYKYKI
ncbi:hypothetical protein QQS21_005296 [Conoideocrella luteorostrata]|uniref:Monooxygenase n=1 Tax=Conoideocrella luteorostrata TaxID=1105319 RepID=A0AAJ0CST5_9HYPO|nr:hypothetical protein QQS21_005296 [Conoideocrella luteorostrata]